MIILEFDNLEKLFLSGLSPAIFKAVMKRGYKVPTPIQRKV